MRCRRIVSQPRARNHYLIRRSAAVLNKTILRRSLLGVGGAALALAVVWLGMRALAAPVMHLADADDNTEVELGKHSYGLYWASCHGRALQGQSLWQLNDKDAGR